MSKEPESDGDFRHKEHPKTCAADDFWGQVSRTVNGVPVSQENIDIIVQAIRDGLSFSPDDVLLDIGCGNGGICIMDKQPGAVIGAVAYYGAVFNDRGRVCTVYAAAHICLIIDNHTICDGRR